MEYTGKTLEEALTLASQDKQCDVKDLKYSVVEENKGLLGLGTSVTINAFTNEDIKEFIFDYLGNFFTAIDEELEVALEETNDGFIVNLNAENNAVLIGKAGKTLAAFNTIVKAAVNSAFKGHYNVLIDVNHYKEDRYSRLRSMARRLGKQVQRDHVDIELDPMPNDERKVIHTMLASWHNIKTESVGEGSKRHLCIRYVNDPTPESN